MVLNKLPLAAKMIVASTFVVIGCFALSTFWISREAEHETRLQAEAEAKALGQKYAQEVKEMLDKGMTRASFLAGAVEMETQSVSPDRSQIIALMQRTMDRNHDMAGYWLITDPNVYDGRDKDMVNADKYHDETGRFIPYFYNFGDGVVGGHTQSHTKLLNDANSDYNVMKRDRQPYLGEPGFWEIGGKSVILSSAHYPAQDPKTGEFIAMVGTDLYLNQVVDRLAALRPYDTGSVNLVANSGIWVSHPNKDMLGKPISDSQPELAKAIPSIQSGKFLTLSNDGFTRLFIPLEITDSKKPWSVVINVPTEALTATSDALTHKIITTSAVVVLVLAFALYWLGSSMIRNPLVRVTGVLGEFEKDNFDVDVPYLERGDEIGTLGRALENFRENSLRIQTLETERAKAEEETERQRIQERLRLADEFESAVGVIVRDVTDAAIDMVNTADMMQQGATEAQQFATDVAVASEQTSANVQTVATATEELSASINEIASQVAMSSEVVNTAVTEAREADALVQGLAGSADRISEIVTLINDIASQTNLLALNATIEAARAGDMGKGFAVVANEVKNLATQTARATDEITGQIEAIQEETKRTAKAINNISTTIDRVNEVSSTIASAIEEQGAATGEISQNVQQAADGTNQVNSHVSQIRERAVNAETAAGQVKDRAVYLNSQADTLSQEVETFLSCIRG